MDEAYGKSTYNYWRMTNDACTIVLNGCAGQKCNGISPTVFHSWTNALRGTSSISLGGNGRNAVGLRLCTICIMLLYDILRNLGPHRDTLVRLSFFQVFHILSTKLGPSLLHLSQRQTRRTDRLITRMLDSSGALLTSSRGILPIISEYLRQRYYVMSVNCECLRQMEQDVTEVLPINKRKDFVVPITDMELLLPVRHGAMNN